MASPGLLELATAEQANAKRILYAWIPCCHALTASFTLAALFAPLGVAYPLALAILTLQVVAWSLRSNAAAKHRRAEEARRRALLMDALGEDAERLDVANIRLAFSKRACRDAKALDRTGYWSDTSPRGPQRLLGTLQESAFWSHALYDTAATAATRTLIAVVSTLFIVALIGLAAFSGSTALAVARVIVVSLSALIALDVLGQALAWRTAARQAEAVDRRLEVIDGTTIEPMLAIVADYAIATASAPPIPDRVYESKSGELDELWREHRSQPRRAT
ncbi:MAG: hypothetical protein WKF96_14995 [Solirubrobacteraceae bacterium]